jgi:signal transduction histidine kinase
MPPAPAATHRLRLGIATWITGVSLLALMPMLAFSAYVVHHQLSDQQAQAMVALQRRATVAAAAIAQEMASVFAALNAMAQADCVRQGDMQATLALAQRVVAADARIASISLASPTGDRPFSTLAAYGTALPESRLTEFQRPVFQAGARLVTPLVAGTVSQAPVVALVAPFAMGPAGPFAVRAVVKLPALAARLNEQAWPEDWVASVLDQNLVIVARSRDAAQFVGQTATASLQAGLQTGQGIFRAGTKEGIEVVGSAAWVPGTQWRVVVGRPLSALNAQVRQSIWSILIAGSLCSLLGVGGALYLARHLGRQLNAVVVAHADGHAGPPPGSSIKEVAALSHALTQAQVAAASAFDELHLAQQKMLAQLHERSEMLDVLAHEVRQPLNNASAALQAASVVLHGSTGPSMDEPLGRAGAVLSGVQASIDNTLAAASLLIGGERLTREDTDIDALIAVAIGDLAAGEAGRVQVQRASSTRTAMMDAGLMRLALRNLLANALKYSPRGTPVVVRVSDSDEPLALLIDVIDAGPGIPSGLLGSLFDRGDRRPLAAGARRHGLGLYIVRRVMELHGGGVRLERNDPGGATMRLVIDQTGDD